MLHPAVKYSLLALLTLSAGIAVAQHEVTGEGEVWRKKTLDAYANAKPTQELASMSALDKLVAIEEIRKIPMRYTRYINQRDWDRWINLFTDESDYWQYTIGKVVSGPKGWRQHLDAVGMTSDKMHSLFENFGDVEIDILSPTTARGVWQELFVFWSPPGETPTKGFLVAPGEQMRVYAIYYQTYRKVNGTWKINTNLPSTIRSERGPLPEGVTTPKLEIPATMK
jgi:hypothetical protein